MNEQKVTHGQGVKLFWKNWANFGGRSTKSEFLHGFLHCLYIGIIFSIVEGFLIGAAVISFLGGVSVPTSRYGSHTVSSGAAATSGITLIIGVVLMFAYGIAVGIPALSLLIRRLRDAGLQTGWIVFAILISLVNIVPFIGALVCLGFEICTLIICFARPSLPVNDKTYFDVLGNKFANQAGQQQYAQPGQSPQYAQQPAPGQAPQYAQPVPAQPVQPVAPVAPAPEQPTYTVPTPPQQG